MAIARDRIQQGFEQDYHRDTLFGTKKLDQNVGVVLLFDGIADMSLRVLRQLDKISG